MQLKLSLVSLSSVTIIFGAIANQSSLASPLAGDGLAPTTTNSSQLNSCTSTNTSESSCTSINNQQVPSSSDRTFESSTKTEESADSITQNEGIDKSDHTEGSSTKTEKSADSTSEFDEQSNQLNSEGSQSSPSSPNPESNSSTSKDEISISAVEQEVQKQINQYRAKQGLAELTLNNSISEQARKHSQNMASGAVGFSHDGFEERVEAIATKISYTSSAENVAYNQGYTDPATKAVKGWLNSPGHLQNIEGNYNQTGIGVAKNAQGEYYFTQIFIRSR